MTLTAQGPPDTSRGRHPVMSLSRFVTGLVAAILAVSTTLLGLLMWSTHRATPARSEQLAGVHVTELILIVLAGAGTIAAMLALFPPLARRPARVVWRRTAAVLASLLVTGTVVACLGSIAVVGFPLIFELDDLHANSRLDEAQEGVAAIEGVLSVSDATSLRGDIATGHNVLVLANIDPDLTGALSMAILNQISGQLASAGTDVHAEARIGAISVAVSPDADLNAARFALANEVRAVSGTGSVSVMWADQGDNVIDDLTNDNLRVILESTSGNPASFALAALPVVAESFHDATLTSIVAPAHTMPSNHYEGTSRDAVLDGRREITVTAESLAAMSDLASALDPLKGLVGYRLALTDTYVAVDGLTAAQRIIDRIELEDGQTQLVVSYPGEDGLQIELRPGEIAPG